MQKKLIALAVAGLMSGAAFAQTSVTIGGKVDAGYQFGMTQKADGVCGTSGDCGGSTTEQLTDGSASTSRITIGAKETINNDLEAGVSLDMRFSNFHDGKGVNNSTTSTLAGIGGLTSNDKKEVYLKSKLLGELHWGVQNAGDEFYVATKPYMVEPKDTELVKYGISGYRASSLTDRTTKYITPTLSIGDFQLAAMSTYSFGEARKSGASNVDGTGSGDVLAGGIQWKFGKLIDGGYDRWTRYTSNATAEDGFHFQRTYFSLFPWAGLKIAGVYINNSGYAAGKPFQDKNTNLVVSYNFNAKANIGFGYSIVRDVGDERNSGHAWQFGGTYFLSKSVYLYSAVTKTDWERNQDKIGGKFDGTASGFGTSSTASKLDSRLTKIGLVKEF
ncbi:MULTISPECIES: porin [unclassified Uliginosibacterium]|uniref:porin n=1 Tax=unclassified Uliginosibacterium TaxID=2621521 RepID=UPI000C7CCDF4|nr:MULTISPECIES: porin [unclassified Uliginosibacterium]MDO6386185.1 porin [Uliginosibacterium sp. 31-12]PLK49252.1 hypothetical protein C0V76_08625 [Uliginosibacterium sp. TH139]